MAIFVNDTFTDTNGTVLSAHTGETGATWTRHTNATYSGQTFTIQANRTYFSSASGIGAYYASGVPAGVEYDVAGVLRCLTNVAGAILAVTGRFSTAADTMYRAGFAQGTGWTMSKSVAGVSTSLGTDTTDGTSLTINTSYSIELRITDATKKLFVGGAERLSSADNAVTAAGRVGVRGFGAIATTTGYHLDSITATDAAVAGGTIPRVMYSYRARRV
jgi:hypothetical protein